MTWLRLVALLLFPLSLIAQNLPAGTAFPVALGSSLNARNSKTGQKIGGNLMQEVSLSSGITIKKGSRVSGHVVSVSKASGHGSRIVVTFDRLQDEKTSIPLNVSLRALAASENVFNAGTPVDSSSTDESSDEWVTKQVGGEFVFRGRGYVASKQGKVGRWTGTGVWGRLQSVDNCPANAVNDQEQALWVFSTTACGVYGIEHATIAQAGTNNPVGQIAIESTGNLEIRGGSGWLLLENPPSTGAAK